MTPPKPQTSAGGTAERPVPKPYEISHHRRAFRHRAHAPAEVGLGTTVLGVLGLVTLPIALIGLALSGGGVVWAVIAAAAALAVLVAYLDPVGNRQHFG